jgi:hypothetical protein
MTLRRSDRFVLSMQIERLSPTKAIESRFVEKRLDPVLRHLASSASQGERSTQLAPQQIWASLKRRKTETERSSCRRAEAHIVNRHRARSARSIPATV